MRPLRDLLATWENWSSQELSRRALANAATEEQRDVMRGVLARGEAVDPLNALRDLTELTSLLAGWRWQVMKSAREAGTSWEEIAEATGAAPEQVEAEFADAVARQMRYGVTGLAT